MTAVLGPSSLPKDLWPGIKKYGIHEIVGLEEEIERDIELLAEVLLTIEEQRDVKETTYTPSNP